jgi:hypothetical protein
MQYDFKSIDQIITELEIPLINTLFDCNLLSKFDINVKKIIMYFLIQSINDNLHNHKLFIYHNHTLQSNHELFNHYPKDKIDNFINKICVKLKKTTNRVFFVKNNTTIPLTGKLDELDGAVLDEVILLNNEKEPDRKKLKSFLQKHNLKDMFDSISKNI